MVGAYNIYGAWYVSGSLLWWVGIPTCIHLHCVFTVCLLEQIGLVEGTVIGWAMYVALCVALPVSVGSCHHC